MNVYLDNAAAVPLTPQVRRYVTGLLDTCGNPSSLYQSGVHAKKIIEQARSNAAKFIRGNPENIIFTPSGSASNTLAVKGYDSVHDCFIFYSPIAHKSILRCVESCKFRSPLTVDSNGFLELSNLRKRMDACGRKPFVVIDYANSEIGTIQNVKEIIHMVHACNGIVYLDCTGAISTIPLDVKGLDIDMCGFSGHKAGGLKGCGVLYRKPEIALEPLIYGNQEQGLAGGTENVLGIASLGKAVEHYHYASVSSDSRDYVYNFISKNIPDSYLVGAPFKYRLPHNLYMCFPGIPGEALVILLDMNGIQVSTGSACNQRSPEASSALTAIGIAENDINSCIRFSFNGTETKEELDYVCGKLSECLNYLGRFS